MSKTAPDQSFEALLRFGQRYCSDAEVRARVARGDTSDLDRNALSIPDGMDIRIVEQTADTFYFPLPLVPNQALSDESLGAVSGGFSLLPGLPPLPTPPPACLIHLHGLNGWTL